MSIPTLTLNDGHTIPAIGFGTFPNAGDDSRTTTISALDAGYRLLDTALRYENEQSVGRAVREYDLPRESILVCTKLAGRHHGYDETIKGCHESLTNLGLDYVDIYLIHWPLPRLDKYVDSWKAMIKLRDEGLVRSIGVSNFTEAHLRRIIDATGVMPVMNQVELHPYFPQAPLRAVHAELGIVTESWSPMGRGELLADPTVARVAEAHGVRPGPGHPALARAVGRRSHPDVGQPAAAARQPRPVRLHPVRRRDGRPLRAGARPDLGSGPGRARGVLSRRRHADVDTATRGRVTDVMATTSLPQTRPNPAPPPDPVNPPI